MNYKKSCSKIIIISLIFMFFCLNIQSVQMVYGETQENTYYFQWNNTKNSVIGNPILGTNRVYLDTILAYPIENADVIELYGITKSQIKDFMDGDLLVLNLENVRLRTGNQYYFDDTNPYLNYCLVSGLSFETVIHLKIDDGETYDIIETEDSVQIYLTKENKPLEVSELEIPIPMGLARISDQDNYLDKNFQIILSGNYVEFYKNNAILNPYSDISNYTITYDVKSDKTILTFYTNIVCGYKYEVEENKISVKVGKPNEIYSKIVLFDAGHGGIDPGAVKNGIQEKDINFKVLNTYVKSAFYNSDIKVYFTRESDVFVDLYVRAGFAEEVCADLFISLHSNANNSSSITGTQVFYSDANNETTNSGLNSSKLAKSLVDNISSAISTKNRGISSSNFIVVKYNTIPAVLVELGFMTNSSELAKITNPTYQAKAADAIFKTITQIFNTYPTGR